MKRIAGTVGIALWVIAVAPDPAEACVVRQAEMEESVEYARALVVARVESVRELSGPDRYFDKTVQYALLIEEVLGGEAKLGKTELLFSRPRAHMRGSMQVCPLLLGSGLEYKLKVGGRYHFLLDGKKIVRAEPLARKKPLARAWKQKGGSFWGKDLPTRELGYVDPERILRATVVMRVKHLEAKGGSKYHWDFVEPIEVYKNESGKLFKEPLEVAHYSWEKGVPEGISTIYLVHYGDPENEHWKLLGGNAETGVSHHGVRQEKEH